MVRGLRGAAIFGGAAGKVFAYQGGFECAKSEGREEGTSRTPSFLPPAPRAPVVMARIRSLPEFNQDLAGVWLDR